MSRNLTIRAVPDNVYLKFRMIALGTGQTSAELLEKMVGYWYNHEKTLPDMGKQRKMKRFVKKLKLKGDSK